MNINQSNQPSQEELAQFQLLLKNSKDLNCECGNNTFFDGKRLKVISKIITGDTKDMLVPIPSFLCSKCNKELTFESQTSSIIK